MKESVGRLAKRASEAEMSRESKILPHHQQLPSQLQQTAAASGLLQDASTLCQHVSPYIPARHCMVTLSADAILNKELAACKNRT